MKHAISILFLLTLAAYASAQPDPREMQSELLIFEAPAVEIFTTDNGIKVVFLENHELPVVRLTMYFPGGGYYDQTLQVGLSEITASLLRSGGAGNKSAEQVDEALDFLGASISSGDEADRLTISMRTLKKDFAEVFAIMADILTAPLFDSAKLEIEKSNRIDRIRRQFDSPTGATRHLFYKTVYDGHGYGNYPTITSVNAINQSLVKSQYKGKYKPNNCYLAISGDLSLDEIKQALSERLGKWSGPDVTDQTQKPLPPAKPGIYYAKKDISQTSFRLGHRVSLFHNDDRHAARIMNYALGVGFTSRLTTKIRSEAGLAYSVGSYFVRRQMGGVFFSFCQSRADATGQALDMILEIITNVHENGITEKEFKDSKEAILNSFVFEYETPHQIAEQVASDLLYGFAENQTELDLEALKAVTWKDCNRTAAEYLHPDSFVIVVVGDTARFDKPLSSFGKVNTLSLEIEE
ncbi:MAG: insulinase family protein [candidate division Zixibacteria bacterium]|nr:insulinase family protein [candidate division Zixibacteria bacterium]